MFDIDILAQLGDMKDINYRNTLAIASIIEILVEKGLIDRSEVTFKAKKLDSMSIDEIKLMRNI